MNLLTQLRTALAALVVFTVLTGIAYPLVMTGIAQLAFAEEANGSVIRKANGDVVGSRLLGQPFADAGYFHPRPSAVEYDSAASGGSNLGPTNPDLLSAVAERAAAYRAENGLPVDAAVPVDAVTTSASGLDPDISLANALLQLPRVAAARGLGEAQVLDLVDSHTEGQLLGLYGQPRVNVLELNLALDALAGPPAGG
jgi:K+-transporting ATPase ATPase C chain